MTLLEILVQELSRRGGWPEGAELAYISPTGNVYFVGRTTAPTITISHTESGYKWECITREHYEAALAAIEPEWNGEGLPPLNTEVEFIMESALNPKWNRCKLMGYSEFGIAIQPLKGEFAGHVVWWGIPGKGEGVKFRPIRSEADRKRDETVKWLYEVFCSTPGCCEEGFIAVYDAIEAGKIPHLKIV